MQIKVDMGALSEEWPSYTEHCPPHLEAPALHPAGHPRHKNSQQPQKDTVFGLIKLQSLVAEWIHFTLFELFGIVLPTIKLKVYIFWGL